MALGFNTTESCEGHIDRDWIGPWVGISPEYPETGDWYNDQAVIVKITEEGMVQRARVERLLEEFNANRKIPNDQRLVIWSKGIYGGLRIQSQGIEENIPSQGDLEARKEKLDRYREEMKQFTQFLKDHFSYK